jgi:hypothetical protein
MRDQFMECEEEEEFTPGSSDEIRTKRKCFRLVESVEAASEHMSPGAVIVSQAPPGVSNALPLKGPAPFPAHRLPQGAGTKVGNMEQTK